MRAFLLILMAAVAIGLAGGYAWSVVSTPSAKAAKSPRETTIAIPPSPEEQPEALDQEWATRAENDSPPAATGSAPAASSVHDSGCNEVRAAGKAPRHAGEPGYRADMDGDGIACEPYRGN